MNITTLPAWTEWIEKCAVVHCTDEHRSQLNKFVALRFRKYKEKFDRFTPVDPSEACQTFEQHMHTGPKRDPGRIWKEWLHEKAQKSREPLKAYEGLVSGCIKTAVRQMLERIGNAKEGIPIGGPESLFAPSRSGNPDGPTWADILETPTNPHPGEAIDTAEFARMARLDAGAIFGRMDVRQRVALAAQGLGLPLSHPEVLRAARYGRQRVNDASHEVAAMAAKAHASRLKKEPTMPAWHPRLVTHFIETLSIEWARHRPECAKLF